MINTTITLTTWSLSKKKALDKLTDRACVVFEKVIDKLKKDKTRIEAAALTPIDLKGFLFYKGTFKIEVTTKKNAVIVVKTKITRYTEPTKSQIKKTQQKKYVKVCRDTKGRFTKCKKGK